MDLWSLVNIAQQMRLASWAKVSTIRIVCGGWHENDMIVIDKLDGAHDMSLLRCVFKFKDFLVLRSHGHFLVCRRHL